MNHTVNEKPAHQQADLGYLNRVVGALRAHSGIYCDGHLSDSPQREHPAQAVALHTTYCSDGSVYKSSVVLLYATPPWSYYCVNDLQLLDDGRVRLTPYSNGTLCDLSATTTLDEQVQQYNTNHGLSNAFYHAQLSYVTRI